MSSNINNDQKQSPPAGRPRVLNDAKCREICALVAGGIGIAEAARYVRCSANTIRREAQRNPEFHDQLTRSEMYAQLSPLRAMQKAAGTHWRAAAWMLERAFPKRFARRDSSAFGPQQARRLLNEVLEIIGSEVTDPFQHERIEKRLRATFEYSLRAACDRRRSAKDLRRAIRFFEEKDELADPLAQFGFPTPDLEPFLNPTPPSPDSVHHAAMRGSPDPASPPTAGLHPDENTPPAPVDASASFSDLAATLRECLNMTASGQPSDTPQPPASVPPESENVRPSASLESKTP